ncbi:MAG: double-strand break repair helicase AddA [Acetobacteraceae bacterium]|nr:double-strand break repair helicase AddA [Acetobacteraceae bacterium]
MSGLDALAPRARASALQGRASDPALSAWVSASAGSGKTRVLIERVLRLLLAGVPPGRILCLTFTRAAAAEMANRLSALLGQWAVAEEGRLAAALSALLRRPPEAAELHAARGLFLRVLEQPGGMRISTIHAFCQSLLGAFPLEAGLAPRFGVLEEAEARALAAEAAEQVLASPEAVAPLSLLAAHTDLARFSGLVGTLAGTPGLARLLAEAGASGLSARLSAALGLPPGTDEAASIAAHCAGLDPAPLVRAGRLLCQSGNENDRARGEAVLAFAMAAPELRAGRWEAWRDLLLTEDGSIRARLATQQTPRQDEVRGILSAAAQAVQAVEDARAAARLLSATTALLSLAAPVLARYGALKHGRGRLDYDDLIARARALLVDPGAAWVQYKLDGGIAHVLLDESQDSNAEQWEIVSALTAEFFAGEGAARDAGAAGGRPLARSVFAVGDPKQSIYRFQGADPDGFLREKGRFAGLVRGAGQRFEEVPLDVSFRSTVPVLALVDAVFADPAAASGVVPPGETLRHIADREGMAGRAELWPPVGPLPTTPPPEWAPPEAPVSESTPAARLAAAVAARVRAMIGVEELPARGRKVRAGDILILLARRPPMMPLLVKALKDAGVPVGGADRIALVEQIGVMDLIAFCEALLLPQDDLTLAALLKSPLVGLAEEEIFSLAHGRGGALFEALMAHRGGDSRPGRAADWFAGFLARVDLLGPYGLLAAVLGEAGPFDRASGRARLLARLGPDAADPLDEVLAAALAAERAEAPSLHGFVAGLKRSAAQVKREPEAAGDSVRVMTVHGAKGLQAPIVILPDTMTGPPDPPRLPVLSTPLGPVPVWVPRREGFSAATAIAALAASRAADAEEARRLLYVALTRAEDRLIVCAQHGARRPPGTWYDLIEAGFRRAGAREERFDPAAFGAAAAGFTGASCLVLESGQTGPPRTDEERGGTPTAPSTLPPWVGTAPPDAPPASPLAPSRLGGEGPAASPGGRDDPAGLRFRRGRLVHALLQHLPAWPEAEREAAGTRFLARSGHGLSPEAAQEALAEALAVLRHPDLVEAFGPDSLAEAPIAGMVNGVPVAGQLDRLAVGGTRIVLLDFKTNRPPPEAPEAVPAAYLRQMAAYRGLLRAAFPGREVVSALVWTYGPRVMLLPDTLLDPHTPAP